MKIDSQGYALVLQRDSQSSQPGSAMRQHVSITPGFTVKNVEEAWRCQQDQGYAALTPPKKEEKAAAIFTPRAAAFDYEVPILHKTPQNSPRLSRQKPVSSTASEVRISWRESLINAEDDVFEEEAELCCQELSEKQTVPQRMISDSISSLPERQSDREVVDMGRPRPKSLVHPRPQDKEPGRRSRPTLTPPSKTLLISFSKDSGVVIWVMCVPDFQSRFMCCSIVHPYDF